MAIESEIKQTPTEEETAKTGASQKIGILLAAIVSAIATGYVPTYINLYYTDTVGISIGAIGVILMVSKLTDGISDIVMGMIIDRTHTKLGKARPWVLAGAAGLALSMMMLFSCPADFSMGGKIAFCTIFYFLANPIFGTMVSVSCGTLPNLISSDSKQRTVIGVFRSVGSMIPVLLIGFLVPQLLEKMGENQHTYTIATLLFAVFALISAVIAVVLIRESVTERSEAVLNQKQPIGESLKALVKNKYFIYLALGTIFYNLSSVPVANYYAKYIFHNVGAATWISLPNIFMIVLLPFAIPIVNKLGKRRAMCGGLLLAAVGSVIIFFANENMAVFLIGKSLAAIACIPYFVGLVPTTGEVCDYALYKSGKPMDGTISSATGMGEKIGVGLSAGLSSLLLRWSGYVSTTAAVNAVQPGSALLMIRILMGLYPAVLFAIAAFFFWKIDLEKNGIEEIQKELRAKGMR